MPIKPIIFNTEMVQAILKNEKTVTRRIIKGDIKDMLNSPFHKAYPEVPDAVLIRKLLKPPYEPGDVLYVRETWGRNYSNECRANHNMECPYDSCDKSEGGCFPLEYVYKADGTTTTRNVKWRPSIHMPREAARIWLKVNDVRVDRLNAISRYDILDEGAIESVEGKTLKEVLTAFAELWDSTIPKSKLALYGWEANPWVWIIEFERCEEGDVNDHGTAL